MANKCMKCSQNYNNYDPSNIETSCSDVSENSTEYNSNCNCGFDDGYNVFPDDPMYAQSYVPVQNLTQTFVPCFGLKSGTIFPELVDPYQAGNLMELNKYLARTNSIGKGCNS